MSLADNARFSYEYSSCYGEVVLIFQIVTTREGIRVKLLNDFLESWLLALLL